MLPSLLVPHQGKPTRAMISWLLAGVASEVWQSGFHLIVFAPRSSYGFHKDPTVLTILCVVVLTPLCVVYEEFP